MPIPIHCRCRLLGSLTLVVLLTWAPPSFSQTNSESPVLLPSLDLTPAPGSPVEQSSPNSGSRRIRLFHMPTGFLQDPVGLASSEDSASDTNGSPSLTGNGPGGGDNERLQVAMGSDNPFFDVRNPGDPGGVGYQKLQAQYQLADTGTTSCSLALQAVTPAGLERDGVAQGHTVVNPALAWYHECSDGTAFHGFIGKTMEASSGWLESLGHGLEYGLAVQSPLPGSDPGQSFHLFLEALGRQHYEAAFTDQGPLPNWELVPGLHWQVDETWWVSGGVVIPLGSTTGSDNRLVQITCSWRF